MPPELYPDRLQWKRTGFRTKISDNWHVFRRGERLPIAGPFRSKREAEKEIANMGTKESKTTETRETATKETAPETAKKGSDPSDPENAENTTTGADAPTPKDE